MKRHYEDPSLDLVGRSAAERRMDRFYNHQRSILRKTGSSSAFDTKAREQKDLPFQSNNLSSPTSAKAVETDSTSRRSVSGILLDLSQRHLRDRKRFSKSLNLLTKLCKGYLDDKDNVEYTEVSLSDFLKVFYITDHIFVSEFSGDVPKDSIDVKEACANFVSSVVDRLLTWDLTPYEKGLLHVLKLDLGYTTSLWYENDSFRFHAILSQLDPYFTNFQSVDTHPSSLKEERAIGNPKPRNDEQYFGDVNESTDQPSESSERAVTTHHDVTSVTIPQNKDGGTLLDTKKLDSNDESQEENADRHSSISSYGENAAIEINTAESPEGGIRGLPDIPSLTELLELQKRAYCRVMQVIYTFFTFPWAKVSIESLFQRVYLQRHLFCGTDQKRITEWQHHIKASKGKSYKGGPIARAIGESTFELKDARDEKLVCVHGSQVWSNRQFGI
ncbi:hypothetical protein BBOV_II001480 [Babesia bovis T2Bo]|uniref:Uncharacterized protein n=1 Tax=Babesia bovis TaxID=5865 RepID=A7AT44_BABBO|nr:hypothetical protein BBOV_II001480 [Babesia bovis T2Bo]EDO06105.1 hypothetical protein BBOV_II001480 [Babesia bovis T2Bo]|eukprot:XP_001609673.1 hypothetical protein [Babesia bovis T2Bo]